jgi:hypothetical protein
MLVLNGVSSEGEGMLVLSLLLAPVVMAAAGQVGRRLGPSAAGWVAALPITFSVAVIAVSLDAGAPAAATMALSAATHVPAQVAFAVVFASVLLRRGLLAGIAAGAVTYAAGSICLADVPPVLAVASAVPALALAPRVMTGGRPRPGARRPPSTTALSCAAASALVAAAVLTSRLAGPEAAGAVAAFPTLSATLAIAVTTHDGRRAGAYALGGLVRSLPCYLTFCLVVALALAPVGPAAVVLGLLACLAAAGATWRAVPVASRPALAR